MEDKVKTTYNAISDNYASEFNKPSEHIDEFLKLVFPGGFILDVGCGPGTDSDYMQSKGYKVIGIDFSDKMISLAEQKNSKIDFKKEDIREISFPPDSFDGLLVSFSIIHLPKKDLQKVIRSFHSILKSKGIIYISIQEGESKEIVIDEPLKPGYQIFLNIVSREEITRLLDENGFQIIHEFNRQSENKEEFDFNKLIIIAYKNK